MSQPKSESSIDQKSMGSIKNNPFLTGNVYKPFRKQSSEKQGGQRKISNIWKQQEAKIEQNYNKKPNPPPKTITNSRIAALAARLGGGPLGGLRGGAAPMLRKKNKQQIHVSLDNSALLDRTVINKGNREKKTIITVNFDILVDGKDDRFAQSMSSNINMKETKPIENSKKKKYGVGGLLGNARGFRSKSKNSNEDIHDNNFEICNESERIKLAAKSIERYIGKTNREKNNNLNHLSSDDVQQPCN
eukprot:50688_1